MASSESTQERTILGHPSGLFVLFFAELWERFCYYGMRALLALYIAQQFFAHESPEGAQELASQSYGGFTAMVTEPFQRSSLSTCPVRLRVVSNHSTS